MPVGAWRLDLGALSRGGLDAGQVGAFLDLEGHPYRPLSVFTRAEAGYDWGQDDAFWRLLVGGRLRW